MPAKGFISITFREPVGEKILQYCKAKDMTVTELLEQRWEERQQCHKLAKKIKIIPYSYSILNDPHPSISTP